MSSGHAVVDVKRWETTLEKTVVLPLTWGLHRSPTFHSLPLLGAVRTVEAGIVTRDE